MHEDPRRATRTCARGIEPLESDDDVGELLEQLTLRVGAERAFRDDGVDHRHDQNPTDARVYTNRPLKPNGETWLYGKIPKFELPETVALPGTLF